MRIQLSLLSLPVASVIAAAVAAGCSGEGSSPPSTGSESDALFVAKDTLWTNGSVDVCFEQSSDPGASHWRTIVQTWVTGSWEQNSQVVFHGWGTCDADSPGDGVRVAIGNANPITKKLGKQLAGLQNGITLNPSFVVWPGMPFDPDTTFGWVAVHEFGHALGFPHEQDRPDAESSASKTAVVAFYGNMPEAQCVQQYADNQGLPGWYDEGALTGALSPIGFYDHISVMNYCNTAARNDNSGVLSIGDRAGLQKLYGAPLDTADINDGSDPVASQFPLSTVNLLTPGNLHASCTGVILAATDKSMKILTTASCKVNSTTTVQFYPTTNGAGANQTGTVLAASSTTPVAVQPGVVCDPDVVGSMPATCYAAGASPYYADLAVLTVDAAPPAGYVAVALGARASLAEALTTTDAWEVGTGWGGPMQWGPVLLDMPDDLGGFFVVAAPFGQDGDSGGPVFQYVDSSHTSANGLVALGLASSLGPCTGGDVACGPHHNTYTSLVYPGNYDWLTKSEGGAPATPNPAGAQAISAFGAAL